MAFADLPLLTITLLIPIIGTLVVFFMKKAEDAKKIALAFSIVPLVLSILIWLSFETGGGYQFMESHTWIESIGISYTVGIDGLSLPMLFLTTLLIPLSIIFAWDTKTRQKEFFGLILLIEVGLIGVFLSLDFFLFYIFWELVLIPMYFFIGIWGGPRKHYAAIKFFIFTHVGSVIMLLAIFAMYFKAGDVLGYATFNMETIASISPNFPLAFQGVAFLAFLFGFAVKMPAVPFHTWLPDAHVEAPTAGSVLLAGVMLKMGGYGLFRVGIGMLPDGAVEYYWVMAALGVVGMIYGALICLAQVDLKKMIAYSSVSHMGFVLLGASALNVIGVAGGIYQMFTHGLVTALLFMMCGVIHHKTGTRDIPKLSGLITKMPQASVILIIGFLASLGLPGMAGFVSELMVFIGAFEAYSIFIIIPLISLAIGAAYYIWTLQRVLFGDFNKALGNVTDLEKYELIPLVILVVFIIFLGFYPNPLLDVIYPAASAVLGGVA